MRDPYVEREMRPINRVKKKVILGKEEETVNRLQEDCKMLVTARNFHAILRLDVPSSVIRYFFFFFNV